MTVISNIESEQSEPTAVSASPGAMLRKERLAQELDQSRAAAQLHLTDAMIEALESDDFAHLPEPVFTQGYLRNYARLLGLPENEVLDAYQRIRPQADSDDVSVRATRTVTPEVRSSHRLVQTVTWLIVLGLLGLVIIWSQDHLNWQVEPMLEGQPAPETSAMTAPLMEDERSREPPASPAFTDNLDADMTPTRESQEPEPEPYLHLPTVQRDAASPALSPPPEPEAVLPPSPPVGPVEAPPTATTQASQASGQAAPQVSQKTSQPASQALQPEPRPAAVGDGQMVFEFTGACWAEVRDSTGKAHIIGEMGAGDRRTVPANLGPYKIVLGNIKFARLTIDDKPFDLSSQTRGVVARFTLDPTRL